MKEIVKIFLCLLLIQSTASALDTDNDGMPDDWEVQYGLNTSADDSTSDFDNDTLTNLEEYNLSTNPTLADTDNDGLNDNLEQSSFEIGTEFRINTYTTSSQATPCVASNGADYIVAWDSYRQDGFYGGIYAQRYNSDLQPLGWEFRINTYTTEWQAVPNIASNGSTFLAVWGSKNQDGGYYGVYAQRYSSEGVKFGLEFSVNQYTPDAQIYPIIATNDDSFFVTWSSDGQDGDGFGVYGRLFDAAGNTLAGEMKISQVSAGNQEYQKIASDGSNYFIVWESENQDGNGYGIYARVYDSSGTPLNNEFQINNYTVGNQNAPAIAYDGNCYLVVWASAGQDGSGSGIYGRFFDSQGNSVGNEFLINQYTTGDQLNPEVVFDGKAYVVVWESDAQDGSGCGVYGRVLNTYGRFLQDEFKVNDYTQGDQFWQAIASNGDSSFVVWAGNGSSDTYGVYGKSIVVGLGTDPNNADTDNDAIPDGWELDHEMDPTYDDSTSDQDGDGLFDPQEYSGGTDMTNPDSDNDGLNDGDEITAGTSPLTSDSDNDTLFDGWELQHGLNPLIDDSQIDSDNDGLNNASEYSHNSEPFIADTDNDGLIDGDEVNNYNTNPLKIDTDGDDMPDGWELQYNFDPTINQRYVDSDNDGMFNGQECRYTSNPFFADSDNDGLIDYQELFSYELTDSFVIATYTDTVSGGGGDNSSGFIIISAGYSDGNVWGSYDEAGNVWEWSDPDFSEISVIRWRGIVSEGDWLGVVPLDNESMVGFRVSQSSVNDNPELGLSTVAQTHYLTSVRATNGSSYFMVWAEDNDIIGQVLDSSFADVSGEFRVNSYTTSTQSHPFAASDGENYLVVWQSNGQDGADEGVFAALYDDQATLLISDTQINSYTPNAQSAPIAASDGDSYFVVWSSYAQDGSLSGVYGRLFDDQLSPMTGEFRINNSTVYEQRYPSMASNGATYLVAWTTNPDGDDAYYNYGRFYNPDGSPIVDEFPISSLGAYSSPVVSANGTIYCVIWMTEDQTSGKLDLYARFYDKFGYTIGDEIKINDDPLETWSICTIINNGDLFLVKWSAYDETGIEKTIFGKYITFTGADPNDPDTDNDSLTDYDEMNLYGTSASNSDTDGDTFADNWELSNGLNPLVDESMDDADNDGLTTLEEYQLGTDFFNPDTDNDGLSDGDEILIFEMGEEFQLNTYTTGMQSEPSIASNGMGYLVTWRGDGASGWAEIYGQMLDSSGNLQGNAFRVNTYTIDSQYYPIVASNGTNYLVTWCGNDTLSSSSEIYGQMLDSSGNLQGSEFRVNTYTTDSQVFQAVASNGTSYLVAWDSQETSGSYTDIYGQMLDSSGNLQGSEFCVNSYTTYYQSGSSIASNGTNYLVTWSGAGDTSTSSSNIYAQMLDSSGNRQGSEFRVNTYTTSSQGSTSIASNGTSYLVTWYVYTPGESSDDIYGQMLDSSGNLLGSEFRVNTYTTDSQSYPVVASNGINYFVTWWSYDTSNSSYDIYGQMLDASGNRLGSEFRVNTYTTDSQTHQSVASNGYSYCVVWESSYQDGSYSSIFGKNFIVTASDPTNPDTDNDGMPDGWEVDHHLNPAYDDSDDDGDGDGLTALGEYIAGTDMTNPDSDNDGVNDGDEVAMGANPLYFDSDNDGMPDGWEVANNLNPIVNDANNDADLDLLSNLDEFLNNSNPNVADTDTDGITDYDEVYQYFTDPLLSDTDGDGLDDLSELFDYPTDALNPDTDGDRINDGDEIAGSTDPLVADVTYEVINRQSTHYTVQVENSNSSVFSKSMHYDIFAQISKTTSSVVFGSVNMSIAVWFDGFVNLNSDADRMPDWWERFYGFSTSSDNTNDDPDSDALVNLVEYLMDMNPINSDTDGDGLPDDWEWLYGTDPTYPDSSLDYDGDLLTNIAEKIFGTDPMNPDTDGDRVLDGPEILSGRNANVAENTFEQYRQSDTYRLDNEMLNSSGTELSTSDSYEHMNSSMIWSAPLLLESVSYNLETGLIVLLATDSDHDGMWDSWELFYGTDPYSDDSDNDSDNDSLTNLMEFRLGSNPFAYDTDNDGQSDWMEHIAGTDLSDAQSVFRAWLTTSIDAEQHIVVEWYSNTNKIYSLYIKDNVHEDFVLYKQSIPGLSDITSFTDMGLDVNNNGSYTDESDIVPAGDESIKQRLYKVIIE